MEKQIQLIEEIYPHPEWKHNSFEELVLAYGREMIFSPLPEYINPGLPKNCYFNCLQLLEELPQLTYCEGYALPEAGILPVRHAWLVNSDREVLDPTWETGEAYIGVPFNTCWVLSFIKSRHREDSLSVFESNYMEKFSLLKEGLPIEAIYYNKTSRRN